MASNQDQSQMRPKKLDDAHQGQRDDVLKSKDSYDLQQERGFLDNMTNNNKIQSNIDDSDVMTPVSEDSVFHDNPML